MKNAGKACNNRLYRHIRTFEKIVKNYFVISNKINGPVQYVQSISLIYTLCLIFSIHALVPHNIFDFI